MQNKIVEIAKNLFNEEVTIDTKLGDITNWDSLGQLNLFMALEAELDIKFSADETIENDSIKKIIDLVDSKKA